MQVLIITGYVSAAAVLLWLYLKTKSIKKTLAASLAKLLLVGVIACISCIVSGVAFSEDASIGAMSLYFITMDAVVFFGWLFTEAYTEIYSPRWTKWFIAFALGVDSVSLFVNPFYRHVFNVHRTEIAGNTFYTADYEQFYYLHLAVCYVPMLLILLMVLYRWAHSVSLYRLRYGVIFVILILIYASNLIYIITHLPIDISVLGYAIGGLVMYYGAFFLVPARLREKIEGRVVQGMSDGIMFIDLDGHCNYANNAMCTLLNVSKTNLQTLKSDIEKVLGIPDLMELPLDHPTMTEMELFSEAEGMDPIDLQIMRAVTGLRYIEVRPTDLIGDEGLSIGRMFQFQDHTEEQRKMEEEHRRATRDNLTGLYNRDYFYHRAALLMSQNPDRRYVLVVSNVKNFKFINDFFGKDTGDDVLKQIAYELTTSCIDGDVYCRLEADHFALLLPQDRFSEEAYNTASGRIRIADDLSYKITVLFGVYKIDPSDSASIPVMCDRCLFAIQASEQNDPRVVRYFDVNMRLDAVWSQQMMKDLQAGLDEEEFRLYIQPQVAVDGSVSGGEVLVRWQHPRDGLIQPGRFVPVLERNGSITKLDYYVWEHTCMVLKRWRDQGHSDAYLSVNISPIDFYYYDIYTIFTGLVREYNIEPGNLRLEITETAVIKNSEAAFDILERVREAGFIVEMDDFGSGYSSLNMLKDLPVDTLKVDMIFLQQSKNEERAQRIIHSIINMAKDLDLEVVTEGVETREQALMLRDMKTDFYQGYYFAKPMPLAEFEEKWLGNTASAWPEDPE